MNNAEKKYLKSKPHHAYYIYQAGNEATEMTIKKFGKNGHNDASDAFRHCFASAILAKELGYGNAYLFVSAHENYPGNPAGEKRMDMHNNVVGLKIGHGFTRDNAALANKCFMAYKMGNLITSPEQSGTSGLEHAKGTQPI